MRLFVALDITADVRERIAEFLNKLRAAYPSARWVRPENLHVTLKFIGEVSETRVAEFTAALSEIHSSSFAQLEFRGTGFFAHAKGAGVFWLGIATNPSVVEIAMQIDERFSALGIAREVREFRPHLTLCRFDRGGLSTLRPLVEESRDAEFGSVRTNRLHLYQSQTAPDGARYTRLASFDFAPGEIA
jgi:2'-5' RNA ligase